MVAPIFTPALLDEIGAAVAGLRPSSCVVTRSTAVDAEGVPTGGSATTIATVGCRVDPPNRRAVEATFGPRQATEADALVYVPRGTPVQARDHIAATIEGVTTPFDVVDVAVGSHLAELPVLCTRSA